MNIVVVVSKSNDYYKDGIRLMTPKQVLGSEYDGMQIDDYLLSSEVLHSGDIALIGKVDEYLSNAMIKSNRRL